jgi:hypothetical protein
MHKPRSTLVAKIAIHSSPAIELAREIRDIFVLRKLEVGKDGSGAKCGGRLLAAFSAVAVVEVDRGESGSGEFNSTALARAFHDRATDKY